MTRLLRTAGPVALLLAVACSDPMAQEGDDLTVTVLVSGAGDGDGWVRAPDPQVKIDCRIAGGDESVSGCEASFVDAGQGGAFELIATADPQHLFGGWSGEDCSGTNPICVIRFTSPAAGLRLKTTATFLRASARSSRVPFAVVIDPAEIDMDADGNLYVGNSGISGGDPGAAVHVRKVTPSGEVTDFGEPIPDPDALIVDKAGSISFLGQGSVLVGGGIPGTAQNNRITEISSDGETTQTLIEDTPPDLMNPASFAFLSNGDLIVGNWSNNSASVLRKDEQGSLSLEPFFEPEDAPLGLRSVVALDAVVYMVTGAPRLVSLTESGQTVENDLWPANEEKNPGPLAVDVAGTFDGNLLAATLDGRILLMDTGSLVWRQLGDFAFSEGVCGMVVSPVEGTLFVAECDGQIWKVTRD